MWIAKMYFKSMRRLIIVLFLVFIVPEEVESNLAVRIDSFDLIIRTYQPVPFYRYRSFSDFRIVHVTREYRKSYKIYENLNKILKNRSFDIRKPTILYIHGYIELTTDESVKTIEEAYLENGGYNLLILDWSNLAFGNYFYVATNVDAVSTTVAKVLSRLCRSGLPIEDLHLVGHSLGAHIAGGIARVMKGDGWRIKRITGLDPAGPLFYPPRFGLRPISKWDGDFVDIIHTDGTAYGTFKPSGHVDFYPNGGFSNQPGCPRYKLLFTKEDFCSHWRSWRYFVESLTIGQFIAVRCDSYDDYLDSSCDYNNTSLMGENVTSKLRGKFYLRTHSRSPFSLGVDGVK